jgi:hypothetical protein
MKWGNLLVSVCCALTPLQLEGFDPSEPEIVAMMKKVATQDIETLGDAQEQFDLYEAAENSR